MCRFVWESSLSAYHGTLLGFFKTDTESRAVWDSKLAWAYWVDTSTGNLYNRHRETP